MAYMVMAYIVMAHIVMAHIAMAVSWPFVMAAPKDCGCVVAGVRVILGGAMAYMVMAYIAMACIVMAYIVMAYIAMACIVMAYIVMTYGRFHATKAFLSRHFSYRNYYAYE